MVAALAFFLGKDEENKDKEDSDSDQEVHCKQSLCSVIHSVFTLGAEAFALMLNFVVLSKKRCCFFSQTNQLLDECFMQVEWTKKP